MNPINCIRKYSEDKRMNMRREAAVIKGDFVYFIIKEGTNIRKMSEDGKVVTYYSREIAEIDCAWDDKVVCVSEYDRIFGSIQ
jgi:hypothetical protein